MSENSFGELLIKLVLVHIVKRYADWSWKSQSQKHLFYVLFGL